MTKKKENYFPFTELFSAGFVSVSMAFNASIDDAYRIVTDMVNQYKLKKI